jgi:hypothetical protein
MPQHDYVLSNQSGNAFRSDLNNALAAAVSQNSGAVEPSPTFAYMPWPDTTAGIFKIRNAANNAWISVYRLDGTFSLIPPSDGAVTTARLADGAVSTAKLANGAVSTAKLASVIAPNVSSINAGPLAGFRNLLVNGNPTINQRGYTSGAATTIANQYTLDRWRVATSGQSISWTDSANVRTVTAPAGGVEQVIEGLSVIGGTYALNWTGTATATINGASVAKGGNVTLAGGTDATVRFSGGTLSLAQLEPGTVATPFEQRPIGTELALCQRYYQELTRIGWRGDATSGNVYAALYNYSTMRVAPSVVIADVALNGFGVGVAVVANGESWLQAEAVCNSTGANRFWLAIVKLSAEL